MTKNRICELLAGAMHCCCATHVLGEEQPKASSRPRGIKPNWVRMAYGIFFLCLTMAIASRAQTFTTLHSFDGTDGSYPYAGLVQASNGKLYGITSKGGVDDRSTVFNITLDGKLTTLYSFAGKDISCAAALIQANQGNLLYGTTSGGTNQDLGTVFSITPSGKKLKTLHNFAGKDGATPYTGLVQATNRKLYGTTLYGGTGFGTVFKMTLSGTLTPLYNFAGKDGANPAAPMVQATNGNLYGTTLYGGDLTCNFIGCGTVFKITPSGTLTTLYRFAGTDGSKPHGGLVQATNGKLYGTTYYGGDLISCNTGCGTVFEITPGGKLTSLYSFAGPDGAHPYGGLVQATDGNLYGTTEEGGDPGRGTVFKITPSGTLTTLYSFCSQGNCTDGATPYAGLIQDTNGNFYGTTEGGGDNGRGTVFSLSVGLHPFVETQTTSGKVGAAVKILGTNLTGATRVTFNGTAAKFTVVSKSEIKATVPVGATTGKVKVTTPSATLSSNVRFRVTN